MKVPPRPDEDEGYAWMLGEEWQHAPLSQVFGELLRRMQAREGNVVRLRPGARPAQDWSSPLGGGERVAPALEAFLRRRYRAAGELPPRPIDIGRPRRRQ